MFKRTVAPKLKRTMSLISALTICSLGAISSAGATPFVNLIAQNSVVNVSTDEASEFLFLEEGLLVAEKIEDSTYNSNVLARIAQAYAARGDFDKASDLLAQASQALMQGDELEQSAVLNQIATGYFVIGEGERAVELLQQSLSSIGEVRSGTYNYYHLFEIVDLYVEFSEATQAQSGLEAAAQFADDIDDTSRQMYALEEIAFAYAKLDDKSIADAGITQIHQRLQAIIASFPNERWRSINEKSMRIAIAKARARYGDTEAAIALIEPVLPSNRRYDLTRVVSVYSLLEDKSRAKSALDDLAVMVEDVSELNDRLAVIDSIALAYANIGEVGAAQTFLNRVLPDPLALYPSGPEEQDVIVASFSKLADTYGRLGDIETQQRLLERTFESYAPDNFPEPNQLDVWQAIMFDQMARNYVNISEEKAPDARNVLLRVAAENDWDLSFQMYLAVLAQAESDRGEDELVQQRLAKAIALLDNYEYGSPTGAGLGRTLQTLTTMAAIYGEMPEGTVKRDGLRSLTQAADGLAYSDAQQRLLSAIALAYGSSRACQPTGIGFTSSDNTAICF